MRAEFDLTKLEIGSAERFVLDNRILDVYYKVKRKYKCARATYNLITYSISALSLSITILSIYLNQDLRPSTTKGISLATSLISAVIAAINQIADKAKVGREVILYKRSADKLKQRIWQYLANPAAEEFDEFQNEIEEIVKRIHELEVDLMTSNLQRTMTPPRVAEREPQV